VATPTAVLELNRVTAGPLRSVSLVARPGEVVAVIGAVGSGRTTLARVIAGLQRPHSGRVAIDGSDVTEADPAERARLGVGLVGPEPRPFPTLTVTQNALVAASRGEARALRGAAGRMASARVGRLLERFGLDAVAGRPAAELTEAQAAVLDVVRVLAAPRRVVVVDELSAQLPDRQHQQLRAALFATTAFGATVLWLDGPRRFDRLADRVVLLSGGRVLADGPVAEVVATPEYRLARAQELVRR